MISRIGHFFQRRGIILSVLAVVALVGAGTLQKTLLEQIREPSTGVDEEMAKSLASDELGMKKYVMAFLKVGDKRDHDKETAAKLQQAHLANITKMAGEGKLVLAGPFMDQGEIRGIYIFNTDDMAKAKEWTETDPAIQAGRLKLELKPWYGSASLQLINDLHRRVQKRKLG